MYLPLIAQLRSQHGLITFAQLRDVGIDATDVRRLVRRGDLVRLRRGVYVDVETWQGSDPYREQPMLLMRAAQHTLTSQFVFSHDSAAIVQRMGAPDPRRSLVHITRPKVHGDAVRAGVKHHLAPYREGDVVESDGLRVLTVARTALDMAREHGRAHGLAACDAALRAGTRRHELDEVLARMQSWPHSRCMRWCVEHADPLAESYLESLARDFVLELGIGSPELQVGFSDGHTTAFVDILVRRHFFEADGMLKYDAGNPSGAPSVEVLAKEKRRHDFLSGFKLGSSRLTHHDLHEGRSAALRRVEREYADTCSRFGTNVEDLAAYRVTRGRRRAS